jgi:predicted DNA-binding WGR domain protein
MLEIDEFVDANGKLDQAAAAKLLLQFGVSGTILYCTDGNHYKFYSAQISGTTIKFLWGRIGQTPRSQEKTCYNETQARNFVESKLNSKRREGYVDL